MPGGAIIDWWALRWMPAGQFAELAQRCGLPVDVQDLAQLAKANLLPPLPSAEPSYSTAHLLVLWSYGQLAVRWRHAWSEEVASPFDDADLEALRERFRPFREWLDGTRYDEEWWEHIEAKMQRLHPLGRARHMGLMLDASVLESMTGEARLFLELDRFFAAWTALTEEGRRDGGAPLLARDLYQRPELASASGPYPPVQRPLSASDATDALEAPRRVGLDEAALKSDRNAPAPAPGPNPDVLSPGEAAREHARRAAEETSALIPLAVAARRSNPTARLTAFEELERRLYEEEEWSALAEHYRASLDLFDDDVEVGRLLKKLALVYLEHLDQVEEGTDFYLRALERLPADPTSLEPVDALLADQGRWEELAAIWQRTATQTEGPRSSQAWLRVAEILHARLGNMPDAIQALRFAFEADPSNTEARHALSNLASLSPEERSGSHPLETTRAEWSRLASIAERWAKRLEEAEEAAEWYERAAELFLSGQDGIDAAFGCLEASLECSPDPIGALSRLESLARHQDRWETFREIVTRYIERESQEDHELRLSLVAEALRERLKTGGVPEAIYTELLERLPPTSRPREFRISASGQHSELARQLIEEAAAPPNAVPVPSEDDDGGQDSHPAEPAEAEDAGAAPTEEVAAEAVAEEESGAEDDDSEAGGS